MTPASHREQLIGLLCEAAEIEHCLMCTYLYAAFSLKQNADEGLREAELAAARRWRAEIIRIATDEMLHLALVNNLLIAIGAPPHYRRFNFPIGAGLFPADVAVALMPFDAATLDHFVYLERPLAAAEVDVAPIAKVQYARRVIANRISPFADDYRTVGELYETIEASFEQLHAQQGSALFTGPTALQLTAREFRLVGLRAVASLDDVRAAVHLIRHQGEGSASETAGSHYARFVAIRNEWRALAAANPAFVPGRPAARNPVMRSPVVSERVQIVAEPASSLVDVANAGYALMVQQLVLLSDDATCRAGLRPLLASQSVALMHFVADTGSLLTQLPAHPDHPGVTAGLSFTVSRGTHGYPSIATAAAAMAERFTLMAERLQSLAADFPLLARYANAFGGFAEAWRTARATALAAPAAVAAAPPPPPASAPVPLAALPPAAAGTIDGDEVVRGQAMVLRFNGKRCIHSRHCVLEEPGVFLANTPGEWIRPDAVSAERIARIARACPSGAIRYERLDGGEPEPLPAVNQVRIRENGPLALTATLQLAGAAPQIRATLCRCGQSRNKPYCDGSHTTAGFTASGEPATRESEPLATRGGPLQVTPLHNGPLEVEGPLEVCAGTGRTVDRVTSARLCRCGHSGNKPFCDGSHVAAGFEADGH